MICIRCNKNKVSTSKVLKFGDYGLTEVEIQTKCIFCRSKDRQIEKLQDDKIMLQDRIQYIQRKLTEMEYKLFTHIYG